MDSEVVSSFFCKEASCNAANETCLTGSQSICDDFLHIIDELNVLLGQFQFPSTVECIYNPTIYARHTFEMYVRKYCNTKKPIMYFGMNPGPWGMSQTGVPFGEVNSVRDWLGIQGPVGKPPKEISARPVKGFDCTRTEVSGKRFWGLFKDICVVPDKFFETSFVYNYIPQQWMKNNGCNVTPGDLKTQQMENLFNICDRVLIKVLELYEVKTIVAIGKFCETRAQKAIKKYMSGSPVQILYMPHPSPRAVNNNNWDQKAIACLKNQNLLQFYQ
ncbi:single-strand selective monofunctional uracil DNA glycosylase [Pectinophora gossypiella]|nr:single-strand selective monofunctional uracil DNA glycosylase [Pectinophora gossypiella]